MFLFTLQGWLFGVKRFFSNKPKQALVFTYLQYKSFEKTEGKGEIAHNEQFLLFPQCFLPSRITYRHFHQIKLSSAKYLSLEESEISRLGKGIKPWQILHLSMLLNFVYQHIRLYSLQANGYFPT